MFAASRRNNNGLLALDVGTHEVRALALASVDNRFEVVGSASGCAPDMPPGGMADLESVRGCLGEVLQRAATEGRVQARRVVAGIGGAHLRCVRARGSLQLRRPTVLRETHVQRVLDIAADLELPRDHEVLHVVPMGFRVDDTPTMRPPIGMRANHLVADASVVTVSRLALDNLERVLESLDWQLVDAAAEPLVSSRVALTRQDRQRGVVLIDIGGETMHATAYRDGALQGVASLAAGGAHITRDLSWALRVDLDEAEVVKRQNGVACVSGAERDRRIEIRSNGRAAWIGQRAIAQVIEPRMSELLSLVRDGLDTQGVLLPASRVVLIGGGSHLRCLPELAERIFDAPAKTATLQSCGAAPAAGVSSCVAMGLVEYATSCGLAKAPRRRRQALQWLLKTMGARVSNHGTGLRAGSETTGATSAQ